MAAQPKGTQANPTRGPTRWPTCSRDTFLWHQYDFVIVGGGTAGLAIAARLTENPEIMVGVLEAGEDRRGDLLIDCPALFLGTFNHPDYDWQFKTTPQEANHGIVHHMPRGKVLGGSSAINSMMYVRGSDQDYDDWAALVGDDSWSSKHMKEYMKKHQTLEPIDERVFDRSTMPFVCENHGTTGPVRTSFNDWMLPIERDIIKACDEATGIMMKPTDPWSGDHIGFFNTLGSVVRSGPDRGKRSYSARGYLGQSKNRLNLKVLCEALVTGIVFQGNIAKGVNFMHAGSQQFVAVNREVIICCGAIQSPQILELSGIGDPNVLQAAGIECRVELPGVGNNFQDHKTTGAGYELAPGISSLDGIHVPEVMADSLKTLVARQAGPLTAISSCQGFFPYKLFASEAELEGTVQGIRDTASASTPFQKRQLEQIVAHLESSKSANLQFVLIASSANWEGGVQDQSKLFPPPDEPGKTMGLTMTICLEYPVSRGSVHITSSDPTKQPAIDPAYLRHPADVAVLGTGLKFVDTMAKAKALEGKLVKRVYPPEKLDLQKSEDNRQAVQDWVMGEYHPCGSCAMGDVVDSRLRVKGVHGLRVADASVFPNHVSGNICSSVYAVAEKAADIIKEDYGYLALKLEAAGWTLPEEKIM